MLSNGKKPLRLSAADIDKTIRREAQPAVPTEPNLTRVPSARSVDGEPLPATETVAGFSQGELGFPGPDDETMWRAFVSRDVAFDGIFYTGVTSTGIFCRPSCPAKKPRRENTVFFTTATDAMKAGFRACRICRPATPPGETPESIVQLVTDLENHPDRRIRDGDLAARGLDPGTVRRWFRRNYGLTFQGYQRLLRLNRAISLLGEDKPVIDVALDSGFDSVSGFGSAIRKVTSVSPSRSRSISTVTVTRFSSPLGPVFAGATERGLCLLEFTDRRMLETEFSLLERYSGSAVLPGTNDFLERVHDELDEYFSGIRKEFDVQLDPVGSDFQKKVWRVLTTIPYGSTRTYREQAELLGDTRLTRAVGQANGRNMIAVIIPCHRVIGENGEPVGYGGGLWRKIWLLNHEKKIMGGV